MANECIPLYEDGEVVTAVTTAAVAGKTFVFWSAPLGTGTTNLNLPSVATATAAGAVSGVAAYDAASGARVPVIRRGSAIIVPVTAGAAITALAEVEVGSGGKAVTKAAGIAVGRALSTGVNNQDCFIELY